MVLNFFGCDSFATLTDREYSMMKSSNLKKMNPVLFSAPFLSLSAVCVLSVLLYTVTGIQLLEGKERKERQSSIVV